MSKTIANPIPKFSIVDILLECESAAHCIEWLLEKYDAGEHEPAIEMIRLLTSVLSIKLSAALEKNESIEAEAHHG
ncbi:TPA: hypothetical protein QDB24_002971 [Burkholderia vietnamiensis]|uniref:hypothetical protein n=1 Tax=Burkholderia vietnamiensis TaxID=60552 RepID=UPI001B8F6E19|nr:hypothetical protein [Burkholderia vietnamiensis]MBR7910343.1 hypothetical protein [Burkholderia vietnamiensis]HDR9274891.1 hypothetical protein [Burkholderia vietnamiensis]